MKYIQLIKDKEQEYLAENFTCDPVGNRLAGPKDKLNYTYNQGNQLTEITKQIPLTPPLLKGEIGGLLDDNNTEHTYDKNGNLTKKIELDDDGKVKRTTLYTYDYENRLVKVEIQKRDKLKIVTFTYDTANL
ncbi:MAG: RHS repeat domain-containing protein [Nitrospinota bacterium]